MANGYDPAAFDIVREEYRDIDTRDLPEREGDRDMPDRVRDDDRDRDLPRVLQEVINNEMITITEEMLPIINDPDVIVDRKGRPARRMSGRDMIRSSGQFSRAAILPNLPGAKKKRKVSKYQKEFGKQLKRLKQKHPRTKITNLMKRAHRATRKVMK